MKSAIDLRLAICILAATALALCLSVLRLSVDAGFILGALLGLVAALPTARTIRNGNRDIRARGSMLRGLYETSPLMMGIVEPRDGDIVYHCCNPATAANYGRTPDEIAGLGCLELGVDAELIAFWIDRYDECRRAGNPIRFEFHCNCNGVDVWYSASASLIGPTDQGGWRYAFCAEDVTERRLAERRLEVAEERYSLAIAGARCGLWDWDIRTGVVFVSPSWNTMVGRDPEQRETTMESFIALMHPEDLPRFLLSLGSYLRRQAADFEIELRLSHTDGSYRWMLARGAATWDENDEPYRMAGSRIDITDAKRAEEAVALSETRFRAAIEGSMDAFVLLDALRNVSDEAVDFVVVDLNARCALLLEHDRSAIVGRLLSELISDDTFAHVLPILADGLSSREASEREIDIPIDMEIHWLRLQIVPVGDGVAVTSRDVTDNRWLEEQIQAQIANVNDYSSELAESNSMLEAANLQLAALATTDGLTGLKNHRTFQERLGDEFARSVRYDVPLSIVMLDVDRFKQFNDTFGHPAGDRVLRRLAAILTAACRNTDLIARYGGEEFVYILPHTGADGAIDLAERVRTAIEEADWDLRPITVSIGIGTLHLGVDTQTELVDEADRAMYASKSLGRNRVTHHADVTEPSSDLTANTQMN